MGIKLSVEHKSDIDFSKTGSTKSLQQELAAGSPNERNWRGIFIALLVIIAVLGLIVFSIVLVTPPEEGPRTRGRKPTLEDIYVKMPPIARFNGTWISDTEFVYKDQYGAVVLYNVENSTKQTLISKTTMRQHEASDFKISPDLRFVLLLSNTKLASDEEASEQFIRIIAAKYHIFELATGRLRLLSPNQLDNEAPYLQYATWAASNTNSIVFIHENDIYLKPKPDRDLVCRITRTGLEGVILNGFPDYLYSKVLLKSSMEHTVWFSPNGHQLLYASFNYSLVGQYRYTWFNVDDTAREDYYTQIKTIRYPQVFSANPQIKIWLVNVTIPKYLIPLEVPMTNSVENGSYLISAGFNQDGSFSLVWLNRHQNVTVIMICRTSADDNTIHCDDLHIEKEHIGWSEPNFYPIFSSTATQALLRLPVEDDENGDFMHICLVQNNSQIVPLTHGAFEVIRILAWDEDKHVIYALATLEGSPGVQHLFQIGDSSESKLLPWTCISCPDLLALNATTSNLERLNKTNMQESNSSTMDLTCNYNNIIFSTSYQYYIQECLGPNIPVVFLVETSTKRRLQILNEGAELRVYSSNLVSPKIHDLQVEIVSNYKAQVRLYLPPQLRDFEDLIYPLVLIVDASPGSQTVTQRWRRPTWAKWYLPGTRAYIVATIDGRGSGSQGIRMRREVYGQIGTVEVQDQLAVLTYLRDTFHYIDRERICVVGRGYGGYVAGMMITQDVHHVINCSVSIAPITVWKYHNSYFTEKYLGSTTTTVPIQQSQVFDYTLSMAPYYYDSTADLTLRAGNFVNRNFLLIYGTADRFVLPIHSHLLLKSMIHHDILLKQLVYPDEDHEFSTKSLMHMYKQIDQFLNESFGPAIDEWNDDTTPFFIK